MKLVLIVTVEELLEKIGQPVSWFRDDSAEEARKQYVLSEMKKQFPGNYVLEEFYNPETMSFKYRLKFLSEQDEIWFKLKYQ